MRYLHKGKASTVGGASPPPPPAVFIGDDSTTSGGWKGLYGANGWYMNDNGAVDQSLPAGITVTLTGEADFGFTFVVPAAEMQIGGGSGTSTHAWYSGATMVYRIDQAAPALYDLSVYLVTPDHSAGDRDGTIEITDLSGTILDGPRSATETNTGDWWRWKIYGSVRVVITYVSGAGLNMVTQGILFDPA